MVSKTDYAYIAGILDGEGHISLIKHNAYGKHKKKYENSYVYSVRVGITNKDKTLIDWLQSTIGGNVLKDKAARPSFIYRWTFNGTAKLEQFLLSVIPYMRIPGKIERAKIVLEYVRLNGQRNPSAREELYLRLRKTYLDERPETNTSNTPFYIGGVKIESDLHSDMQSAPAVTQEDIRNAVKSIKAASVEGDIYLPVYQA